MMSVRIQGPPERRSCSPDSTEVAKAMPTLNAVMMFLMLRTLRTGKSRHKHPCTKSKLLPRSRPHL